MNKLLPEKQLVRAGQGTDSKETILEPDRDEDCPNLARMGSRTGHLYTPPVKGGTSECSTGRKVGVLAAAKPVEP